MKGINHYRVLSNAYGRKELLEMGKNNGLSWQEDNGREGVNWMRFSRALVKHLDEGKHFDTDSTDTESLQSMLDQYTQLRDMHKQTMIPHVRAGLSKLHAKGEITSKDPMEYLPQVYDHLDANGGHIWAEKVRTLSNLNSQIKNITEKLSTRQV